MSEGHAQDETAVSNLPPIFAPGNRVTVAGRTGVINIVVQEVRGEWILAMIQGQEGAAWLRPASMDATWSQAR